MLVSLILAMLLPSLGYAEPLAANSLLIAMNFLIAILFFFAYRSQKSIATHLTIPHLLAEGEKVIYWPLSLAALFPVLGVLGAYTMNVYGSNIILLASLFLILLYVILLIILRKRIPNSTYPFALCMISLAILLQRGMTSNYLMGGDIYSEYMAFQATLSTLNWEAATDFYMIIGSLDITILPTAFASLLDISPLFIYKLIFPLLISILPLIAYVIYEKQLGSFYSFLAAFFIVAQLPFIQLLSGQMRVAMALIPFSLTIMILLDRDLLESKRQILFLILVSATVISYYVTPVILVIVLALAWLLRQVFKRVAAFWESLVTFGGTSIFFLFVAIFLWWFYVNTSGFSSYVTFVNEIVTKLGSFFIEGLRSTHITRMYDLSGVALPDQITSISNTTTFILIAIGVLTAFFAKSYRQVLNPNSRLIMLASLILLGLMIILPAISYGYGPDRLYLQVIILVAPGFIIGAEVLSGITWKGAKLTLLTLLLITQFLTSSYLIHHIMGYPNSNVYNLNSQARIQGYVYDSEMAAAAWLAKYNDVNHTVFVGNHSQPYSRDIFEFLSYEEPGYFSFEAFSFEAPEYFYVLYFEDFKRLDEEGRNEASFIFLRHINVVDGQVIGILDPDIPDGQPIPINNYFHYYGGKNMVFTTGDSEIYSGDQILRSATK